MGLILPPIRRGSIPISLRFQRGTQVALVRQAILFDNQGKLAAAPITESIQIRVYHAVTPTQEGCCSGDMSDVARNQRAGFLPDHAQPCRNSSPAKPADCALLAAMKENCQPSNNKGATRSMTLPENPALE